MVSSGIEISENLWPLVLIRYGSHTTPEDWERMFAAFGRIHRRRERFFTINDATNAGVPSARERGVIGRLSREQEAATRVFLVGSCVVNASSLVRGAITAINWLAPPTYALTVVATMKQAYAVAATGLRDAGLQPHRDHEALLTGSAA